MRFAEQQILQKHWSPDASVGFCHTQSQWRDEVLVGTKTLYNYIDRSLLKARNIDLVLKVRRQNKTSYHRKNKKALGNNIDQRPIHIDKREEFGHWEIDTVIDRASGDSAILTLIERKNEMSVNAALKTIIDKFGDKFAAVFRSITSDNGSEFAGLDDLLSPLKCQVYFAHPYSSWERGTNERHNGLIRLSLIIQ